MRIRVMYDASTPRGMHIPALQLHTATAHTTHPGSPFSESCVAYYPPKGQYKHRTVTGTERRTLVHSVHCKLCVVRFELGTVLPVGSVRGWTHRFFFFQIHVAWNMEDGSYYYKRQAVAVEPLHCFGLEGPVA
jgi:hypothetical protein